MHKIIILGKVPPPYMGTSVWFEILRNSDLNKYFEILWFNVNVHKDFSSLGKGKLLNIRPNIKLYFKFYRTLKSFEPQLVLIPISQSTPGFVKDSIFIILARRISKTLIMLHGSKLQNWLKNSSWFTKRYFSATLKGTAGAIVLGTKLKEIFLPWFEEKEIFVIPNGLNFKSIPREVTSSKITIRYIGSLSLSKGILEIIEAARILRESDKEFIIILNGVWRDKTLEKTCTKIIDENSLQVFYEGEVTDGNKIKAYSETEIFVFTPNKPEGHPFVIIEAMAAGLPIITTDQGAITESVIDGVNGFIVDPNRPDKIAEKIAYFLENPEIRIKMGMQSRRLYEEKFTEEKMVGKLVEVINNIIIS